MFKSFLRRIKNFFLPPPGTPLWQRLLPYIFMGFLTLAFLVGSAYAWEYTNSVEFCGTSCHTMPPEYTAYLVSPHARVDCVDCHIGKGFIATRITRKAGDIKHITSLLFKEYEFPITAGEMRPARETCERCHFPEKFSDDSLREIKQFASDKENTPSSIFLVLKTGGGSARVGLGSGIHWHIENPVYYYPTDSSEQTIPYVKVINPDGSATEYIDIESDFDPAAINEEELEEMDCITCHNRITHLVPYPEDMIDEMIQRDQVSRSIPEIRRLAIEAFYKEYTSKDSALLYITSLENYYKTNYADFYAENSELIQTSIQALREAYDRSVFPEQKSDWSSHKNNVGHLFTPGCFRCHDGKHLNALNEAVRLECNLCHSIPVVAETTDFVTNIEVSRGLEPTSHFDPNWISYHHIAFDQTCSACHSTEDPGGISNTSFCSNSACHGIAWDFAGFDAPKLREILLAQQPTPTPAPTTAPTSEAGETPGATDEPSSGEVTFTSTIGAIFEAKCSACHGDTGVMGLVLTSYEAAMQGGDSGTAILPGDAEGSLLIEKQTGDTPHFGQFSSDELQTVIDWINAGAME